MPRSLTSPGAIAQALRDLGLDLTLLTFTGALCVDPDGIHHLPPAPLTRFGADPGNPPAWLTDEAARRADFDQSPRCTRSWSIADLAAAHAHPDPAARPPSSSGDAAGRGVDTVVPDRATDRLPTRCCSPGRTSLLCAASICPSCSYSRLGPDLRELHRIAEAMQTAALDPPNRASYQSAPQRRSGAVLAAVAASWAATDMIQRLRTDQVPAGAAAALTALLHSWEPRMAAQEAAARVNYRRLHLRDDGRIYLRSGWRTIITWDGAFTRRSDPTHTLVHWDLHELAKIRPTYGPRGERWHRRGAVLATFPGVDHHDLGLRVQRVPASVAQSVMELTDHPTGCSDLGPDPRMAEKDVLRHALLIRTPTGPLRSVRVAAQTYLDMLDT
jgi:hypothetical protein